MGTYSYTGSAQFVTVATSTVYSIKALGAQGGTANFSKSGGLGAYVGGNIPLMAGEELEIIVGGAGKNGGNYSAGGGGGGTFVLEVNGNGSYTPLLIAGGGGGGAYYGAGGSGVSAAAPNSNNQPGGGGGAILNGYGGGGTGLNQNGLTSGGSHEGGGGGFNRSGNYAGGAAGYEGGAGGFGGGGGASLGGGGGGGGYSGGNGGGQSATQTATGGSSFFSSSFYSFGVTRLNGVRAGNGAVTISPQAGMADAPTTVSIYNTSAGTNSVGITSKAGKTFGFSFTTTDAVKFSSYDIALNNPGTGSGTVSFFLDSNSASNTPGTQLLALETVDDGRILGNLLASGSGQDYQLAANTRYWLVAVNSAASTISEVFDNASPGIGYASEYQYDSSKSTTQSFANAGSPIDGEIQVIACYASGTLIQTNRGEVPVEILAIGDTIVTAAGQHRRIKWLGRRSYAGRFLAANPGVQPIRFRAGSLGAGLPRRDLLVSPDHAMALDGLLIPARCLVNGATIVQERGLRRVDYFHVELDSHDLLLAEGAPSESFMDDGSRDMFRNAAEFAALYPDAPRPDGFCAPRVESGYQLEAIRAQLGGVPRTSILAA